MPSRRETGPREKSAARTSGTLLVARLLVGAAALAILAVTLYPTESAGSASAFECLICGERGLADAILNVILFAPLGMALGLLVPGGRSDRRLLVYAALLSLGVELAQFFIPGRDASPGDLLFNTLGAGVGVLLVRHLRWWCCPGPRASDAAALAAAAFAVLMFATPGMLLQPSFPEQTYYVMWTPDLLHLEQYDGSVTAASLGPLSLPPVPTGEHARWKRLFHEGAPLAVQFRSGTPKTRLSSIVSTFDSRRREVLLIGVEGNDLVARIRMRAAELRLDQPDLRVREAMADLRPGSAASVVLRRAGREYCLQLDGRGGCGRGFTIGSGWTLLLYLEQFPAALMHVLDYIWVLLLAALPGFWLRRSPAGLGAVALLTAGAALAPRLTALLNTPPLMFVALLAGTSAGYAAARWLRPRVVPD